MPLVKLESTQICFASRRCNRAFTQAVQFGFLAYAGLKDLGSALARSAEKVLGGSFHPTTLMGPNRMLLEGREDEERL